MNEFARFARDLARAAAGIEDRGEAAVEKVGRGALETAKRRAPVDSGTLRAELRMRRRGTVAVVESPTFYARFVEYPTSDTAAQPFIGPAFDEWAPRLVEEVEKLRDDVVEDLR